MLGLTLPSPEGEIGLFLLRPLFLAFEGPDSIKPLVIPALNTSLDSLQVENRPLCPVRALRFYLEKSKSLRKGKALLIVSLSEGYLKDISRIKISQ